MSEASQKFTASPSRDGTHTVLSAPSSPTEATSASAQSPENLSAIASALAEVIHRREAAPHRGVMPLSSIGLIAIYNSHPYAASTRLRNHEQAEVERALDTACISVLASASFPPDGTDCGYTRVMLVCGDGETAAECSRICVEAWEKSKEQLALIDREPKRARRKEK